LPDHRKLKNADPKREYMGVSSTSSFLSRTGDFLRIPRNGLALAGGGGDIWDEVCLKISQHRLWFPGPEFFK
jgi:hypothetical protein